MVWSPASLLSYIGMSGSVLVIISLSHQWVVSALSWGELSGQCELCPGWPGDVHISISLLYPLPPELLPSSSTNLFSLDQVMWYFPFTLAWEIIRWIWIRVDIRWDFRELQLIINLRIFTSLFYYFNNCILGFWYAEFCAVNYKMSIKIKRIAFLEFTQSPGYVL